MCAWLQRLQSLRLFAIKKVAEDEEKVTFKKDTSGKLKMAACNVGEHMLKVVHHTLRVLHSVVFGTWP